MQITINEAEIKTAVRNHILSQLSVNHDMEIDIKLMATRGDQGYTALIDIHPAGTKPAPAPEPTSPAKAAKPKNIFSPSTKSGPVPQPEAAPAPKPEPEVEAKLETATETPVEAPVEAEAAPAAEAANDQVEAAEPAAEAAPAPARRSIFTNLTKPSNKTEDQPATA